MVVGRDNLEDSERRLSEFLGANSLEYIHGVEDGVALAQ
jgi:hypothetical protein